MNVLQFCEKHAIVPVHYASVKMLLDKLTDAEMATQYNVATAGWDPTGTNGFEKLKGSLWTGKPPSMRTDELEIFGFEIGIRLEVI